jgi:hypothetical protein
MLRRLNAITITIILGLKDSIGVFIMVLIAALFNPI